MSRVPRDLDRVFESRAPVLSGLFTGAVSGSPRIALGVPVLRGEDVIYSLNVGLSPERIGAVLGRRSCPKAGWPRCWTVPARSSRARAIRKFVGQKAVPALARAVQDERGFAGDPDQEGTPVYGLQPFRLSGWTVAASAPMTLVTTDLYRSIAWIALGTLAAFGLGLWLA